MLARLRTGAPGVAGPDRLDDRHVELGELGLIPQGLVGRERGRDLDPEHEPRLQQRFVARQLDHRPVERDIVRDLRAPVGGGSSLPHRLELAVECAHVAGVSGRLAGCELLERRPDGKHRQQLRVVDGTHARATKRLRFDEAQELEIAERLAHGRLARAELARQPRLDQALSRLELPPQDPFEENVLDLLTENGSRDAHEPRPIIDARLSRVNLG